VDSRGDFKQYQQSHNPYRNMASYLSVKYKLCPGHPLHLAKSLSIKSVDSLGDLEALQKYM